MPGEYVVDAHALVWFFVGSDKLGAGARAAMENPASKLIVPAIAVAEACRMTEKGRANIRSVSDLFRQIDADPRIVIYPLTYDLIKRSHQLGWTGEMQDRQVVATALHSGAAAVLTADSAIQRSGLVAIIWD